MSGLKKTTKKNLMVFSGRAHPELAEEVAAQLGTKLVPTSAYEFANSEIYVRYEESVRGCDAFVIQSHTAPINEWIMEHLIMVDALKRASAKRITVVQPFYGYARQDKKHRGREPISARLMADLFKTAGADRLICVDLHADQIQGFFDGPVDHLMALPILADYVREKYGDQPLAVVSPDAGRIKVAERWSAALGGAPLAFIHKTRREDRPNEVVANRVVGRVDDRICVLVDDMIDTGGTIVQAAEALMADGAAGVVIAATHALLSGPAVDRLKNCSAAEVVVTSTLPIPAENHFDKLTVLSIAPLLSRAIKEVFEDGSVTSMFGGHACRRPLPSSDSRLRGAHRSVGAHPASSVSSQARRSRVGTSPRKARSNSPPAPRQGQAGKPQPTSWRTHAPGGQGRSVGGSGATRSACSADHSPSARALNIRLDTWSSVIACHAASLAATVGREASARAAPSSASADPSAVRAASISSSSAARSCASRPSARQRSRGSRRCPRPCVRRSATAGAGTRRHP